MGFLDTLEILLEAAPGVAPPCARAASFAAELAANCGARVYAGAGFPLQRDRFTTRSWQAWDSATCDSVDDWVRAGANRVLIRATSPDHDHSFDLDVSCVEISMDRWESEATLFAASGLADLLGDPECAPLFPRGHYAAGSIGYAAFAALCGVVAKQCRFGTKEVARLTGLGPMSWINWKAASAGAMGNDIHREGEGAEWPVMACRDGYVALIYTERDWPALVEMIGDEELRAPHFETFGTRKAHRDDYLATIRAWVSTKTKAELAALFLEYAIPGAPVLTPSDLFDDPLLGHRRTFESITREDGTPVKSPVAAHRVVAAVAGGSVDEKPAGSESALPLAGLRVLDLGIITAGAGTTGLLADLGAEVIKVESLNYPDPMRLWAGSTDSPLFKFNNRNKHGVAIDLKTEDGKKQFFELAATADVVVENFRRGVLDRLGLTFEALREVNPGILLASVSGQGLDGPGSGHATYGSTLEASSGFSAQTSYDDGRPFITGRNVNYPDQTVCFYAAAMIALGAITCREEHCAMHLDVSQRDVAVYLLGDVLEKVSAGGAPTPDADFEIEGIFPSADKSWVAIAIPSADLSDRLLGQKDVSRASLAQWTRVQAADAIVARCRELGIGAAECLSGSEMYQAQRGEVTFATSPSGDLVKGFPFQFVHSPMTIHCDAPAVGEHTHQYLKA